MTAVDWFSLFTPIILCANLHSRLASPKQRPSLRQLIRALLQWRPMLAGSLVEQYGACGKTGCRCARGQKHGPLYYLFWKEEGRSRSRYIPREQVGAVRRQIRNYHKFQTELLAALRRQRSVPRSPKERSR
jgi:hypothetical protein